MLMQVKLLVHHQATRKVMMQSEDMWSPIHNLGWCLVGFKHNYVLLMLITSFALESIHWNCREIFSSFFRLFNFSTPWYCATDNNTAYYSKQNQWRPEHTVKDIRFAIFFLPYNFVWFPFIIITSIWLVCWYCPFAYKIVDFSCVLALVSVAYINWALQY